MATYKCVQSGNTVTFTEQHDIDSMKGHTGYVLVEEPAVAEEPVAVRQPRARKVIETSEE